MADILAHFHDGPLQGEERTLDAEQAAYPYLDDVSGRRGRYVRAEGLTAPGRQCFFWDGWQAL